MYSINSGTVRGLKVFLYMFLLTGLYHSAFVRLIGNDWTKEDYTYCYLIPVVVLYIIWGKRKELADFPSIPTWKGLIPVGIGILLFWIGELSGEFFTLYLSFWLVLVGISWIHLGWRKLRRISFALLLMLTMFPLPNFLYNKILVQLKLVASHLGVTLMQLYGLSAYREGNIIDIGYTQLQVVDACSGLRYMIPLIVLSIVIVYFSKETLWVKAFTVLSTVPLSIVTNSIRIASTGILYEVWGAKVAEGFFHGFSGWFIFLFAMGMLFLEMHLLSKIRGVFTERDVALIGQDCKQQAAEVEQKIGIEPKRITDISGSTGAQHQFVPENRYRLLFKPTQFVATVLILTAVLITAQKIDFRENIPASKPLNEFPVKIGEWMGTRSSLEQKFLDVLDLSDYIMIDFRDKINRNVNFYVAYYESQSKGASIHSPATCLPGTGWVFEESGRFDLAIQGYKKGSLPLARAFIQKGAQRQLAYYWFAQRGRNLTNAYQLKFYNFWDALTRQRTDGALVRILTPVYGFEKLEETEARLQDFTRKIAPVLAQFLPG